MCGWATWWRIFSSGWIVSCAAWAEVWVVLWDKRGILCRFCHSLFSFVIVVSTLSSGYVRAAPPYRMVNAGTDNYFHRLDF